MSAEPRFSVIVPAYNEQALLPRLLDTVDAARDGYRGGADAIEVIVADNGSTDATAAQAALRGCRVVTVEQRIIGAVRNGGARAARGAVLCFVDADFRIHPETFNAIERVLASGRVVAGATGVTMERWSLGLAVTFAFFVPFLWLTGLDTGVVFCRRDDFEAIGGYDETRRYAEDIALLLALRKRGRATGRGLGRVRAAKAIASARKFDQFGDWHYLTELPKLLPKMVFDPGGTTEFVERYWYRQRQGETGKGKREGSTT